MALFFHPKEWLTQPVIIPIDTEFFATKVGEQEYSNVAVHRLPGFSMYSNTHPQARAGKEIQGADIYVSAHTHRKGHSEQPVKSFGGIAKIVHYISVGAYKATDDHAKKWLHGNSAVKEMYGSAVVLNQEGITYFNDILEARKSSNIEFPS